MVRDDDPRLTEAREKKIAEVAEKLQIPGLRRSNRELVAPCPVCGGRSDRLQINPDKNVWLCRGCGGGDVIGLVRLVLACDFETAVTWLAGDKVVEISPEEKERREKAAAKEQERKDRIAAQQRAKAIARAVTIWKEAYSATDSPVADYLAIRGLPPSITESPPKCLRFHPALAYMVEHLERPNEFVEIHRGPAMLASLVTSAGKLIAVHRTWLDLSQPKGKAKIIHNGEQMAPKKYMGSMKGCAIRLSSPVGFKTLVMGEGIETTLTAMAADVYPDAAYWAGADLGNMAGRRVLRGEGMKYAGIPDLDDEDAFVPPPWVKHLIFIQDGDSEPRLTRAKLVAGLRRARAKVPGLERVSIAHAGEGRDLNDVLMGVGE